MTVDGMSASGVSKAGPRVRTRCHKAGIRPSSLTSPGPVALHMMSVSSTRSADASAAAPLTHSAAGVTRAAAASVAQSRARGQVPDSVR